MTANNQIVITSSLLVYNMPYFDFVSVPTALYYRTYVHNVDMSQATLLHYLYNFVRVVGPHVTNVSFALAPGSELCRRGLIMAVRPKLVVTLN